MLIGGTARTTNVQASLSGGNAMTSFLLSGNYNSQSSVFPEAMPAERLSARLNLTHSSPDKKFNIRINTVYASDNRNQPFADLTKYILLPPNAPSVYDSAGKLNWVSGVTNPMSYLFEKYKSETINFLSNASASYELIKDLTVKMNVGFAG